MSERAVNILLVDDDEVDRMAVARLLARDERYGLREATDIDDAMGLLGTERFDCLLADYNLGPQTAFELLSRMNERIEDPPSVVLLTGMGSESIAVEALKLGVCDYVAKDALTSESLDAAVDKACRSTSQRRALQDEHRALELLSLYDQLTGLPNRSLFLDRLGNLIETSRRNLGKFAVLMIDLDGFKQINDVHGHKCGDEVLCEIGRRLREKARESDTFARLGGDEFTALLPGAGSIESVVTIAAKLARTINDPILCQGEALAHGVSIGIAVYPRHGYDANTLLHNADLAMYQAKKAGLDFCVYDPAGQDAGDRVSLLADASPRSETDPEIVLCYQPKIALDSGEISGAEVLLRRRHPELGLLPPTEVPPAAGRASMVRKLTYGVLQQAARQAGRWRREGFELPLAINLPPAIVEDRDLPARLLEIMESRRVAPGSIVLEITESALSDDPRRVRQQLETLAGDGFNISIDDFGTGYGSMDYLRDLPFREVKIDRSFVQQLGRERCDESTIAAIVGLADGFGAACVAEGVESEDTWKHLLRLGCQHGQGRAISRPLAAGQFRDWVARWARTPRDDGFARLAGE